MTYTSNWIEVKGQRSEADPSRPKILCRGFAPPHENYGPYALVDWAQIHNLVIHHVDNCWVRVELSNKQLRCFLTDLYGATHSYFTVVTDGLEPDGQYVVVAEEF
jgi:hypothetical protein